MVIGVVVVGGHGVGRIDHQIDERVVGDVELVLVGRRSRARIGLIGLDHFPAGQIGRQRGQEQVALVHVDLLTGLDVLDDIRPGIAARVTEVDNVGRRRRRNGRAHGRRGNAFRHRRRLGSQRHSILLRPDGGKTVGIGDGDGGDRGAGLGQSSTRHIEGEGPRRPGGADEDAIDTALDIEAVAGGEVREIGAVANAAVVAAEERSRAAATEGNGVLIRGTALALGIDRFHVEPGDIGTIRAELSGGSGGRRQLQGHRRTCGGDGGRGPRHVALVVVAGRLDRARLPGDVVEGEDVVVHLIATGRENVGGEEILRAETVIGHQIAGGVKRLKTNRIGIAGNVNRLHRSGRIIPMAHDVKRGSRGMGDLETVEDFLRQPGSVYGAADAGHFGIVHAAIGHGIGPDDLGAAHHHALGGIDRGILHEDAAGETGVIFGQIFQHHVLRILQAEIGVGGIAAGLGNGEQIVADEIAHATVEAENLVIIGRDVEVTAGEILGIVGRAVAAGIEHRGVIIPNTAGRFAPGVLGIPERIGQLVVRTVHRAGKFADAAGDVAVVRAQSREATATRIVRLADAQHIVHVLGGEDLVAGFVEEDAGIIPVVDGHISHDVEAFLPGVGVGIVALVVRGRDDHDDAEFIGGLDLHLARGDVHGADEIGVALLHEQEVVLVEPVDRGADGRPLHGTARSVAIEVERMSVDFQTEGRGKGELADAGGGQFRIDHRTTDRDRGVNLIEVGIGGIPEVDARHIARGVEDEFLSRRDGLTDRRKRENNRSRRVDNDRVEGRGLGDGVVVLHFRLHGESGGLVQRID